MKAGEEVRLKPHYVDVLVYLADRPNKLVSIDAMLNALWPRTETGDYTVHNAISSLRRALHDNARNPAYIATVPKQGYRLIADVRRSSADQDSNAAALAIAVLPFENMSSDPELEHFGDGLAEDILNGLVNSSQLKVIARASSFKFKGKHEDIRKIGRELGVSHVVEGSVRKVGSRTRVTAQLNSTTDGSHLWSEQYDRELTDVFAVQDEITKAVLSALNVQFAPVAVQSRTRSIEVRNALRTGRYFLNRREIESALDAFGQAIEFDPNYAQTHALIASAHYNAMVALPDRPTSTRAAFDENLRRALDIDPNNRLGLALAALARFSFDRDYQAGISDLHSLLVRYPSDVHVIGGYASVMRTLGKWELCVDLNRKLVDLDPLSAQGHRQLGESLMYTGRYDEAERSARQAERLGMPVPYLRFGIALMKRDEQTIHALLARDRWGEAHFARDWAITEFAITRGDKQTVAEAVARMKRLPKDTRARFRIPMLEGDVDGALDEFERMANNSDGPLWGEFRDPHPAWRKLFPEVFAHPRYFEILERIGLDDESVAKLVIPPLPFWIDPPASRIVE